MQGGFRTNRYKDWREQTKEDAKPTQRELKDPVNPSGIGRREDEAEELVAPAEEG